MLKITKTLATCSILALGSMHAGCVSDIVSPVVTESTPTVRGTTFEAGPYGVVAEAEVYGLPVEQPLSAMDLTHDGERLEVGISAGIAIGPADGAEPFTLLRAGDDALFRAKRAGLAQIRR